MSTCVSSSLAEPIMVVSNTSNAIDKSANDFLSPPSPDRKKRPHGNVEEDAPPATRPSRTRRDAFHDERNQSLVANLHMPEGFVLVRGSSVRGVAPLASNVLPNAIFMHCVYGPKDDHLTWGNTVTLYHSVTAVGSDADFNLIIEPASAYYRVEKGWYLNAKLRTNTELAIGHNILAYQYGNLQVGSWLYCGFGEVPNVKSAHAESRPCIAYQVMSLNDADGTFFTGPATDCSIARLVPAVQ